jgi:acyl transferase domain-containing protein
MSDAADINSSRRVLVALQEARARLEAAERAAAEPIAVVGIGCRFPGGANGPDAYWRLLLAGFDAVGPVPPDRYDVEAHYDPTPGAAGKMSTREGAFLAEIDQFDAEFFGVSPREASTLDPQQRLLLEVTWEALEHAGQAPDQLCGSRTGVFVGIGRNDYAHRLLQGTPESITPWHATGNGFCYGPGRLAHVLDLKGPNMAIDTACSSSLMAVHLACQSLRLRECDLAIAGGCHLHLAPQVPIMLSLGRALAADGRCKTFDADADGFGQGEGCGIVVLRRLADTLGRSDNILALIRGSATNHDGHSSGLTVPNQAAQEQVIRDALANGKVSPSEIGYVEAHGTGTPLGDPIEIDALRVALCGERPPDSPLRVGSVKTNIGHLEAAAGIAGLIKVALILRYGDIPPHLHLQRPNPRIGWDDLPIEVPVRRTSWTSRGYPRLAGVSSFGMSGANVHVVLQEPPITPSDHAESERPLHCVALSARSAAALRTRALALNAHLQEHPQQSLGDVAFTANAGRMHFPVRVGLVASSSAELCEQLSAVASGASDPVTVVEDDAERHGVVYLFPGQGSQYHGMASALYATEPMVRRTLDRCDNILRPLWQASLYDVLFAAPGDRRLNQTLYTQPALFCVEYALAELWQSWGVVPRAVLGHSVGEYVAACVAGVLGLEDALQLIAERARLMQGLPAGKMVAVLAAEQRVRELIDPWGCDISVAAVNGPTNVVIAGPAAPMRAVVSRLEAEDISVRALNVSHAFHSAMMEPMLAPFTDAASRVSYARPRIDLVSNITGDLCTRAPGAEYWARHIREPVRFADGIDTLAGRGHRIFLEVGPGNTLIAMTGRQLSGTTPLLLPGLVAGRDDWRSLLETIARLYQSGVAIDWAGIDRAYRRRRVPLPTYPFERRRFWHESPDDPRPVARPRPDIPVTRLRWQEQPLRTAPEQRSPPGALHWLVLADHGGIGEQLGRLLEQRGHQCTYVEAGARFSRTSAARWAVNPADPSGFARLLEECSQSSSWTGILVAWGCDTAPTAALTGDGMLESQVQSCTGLLHLTQVLLATKVPGRLWLLTRNAVPVDCAQRDEPDLSHVSIWGMGKAIGLEIPSLWGGMIDLSPQLHDSELMEVARELEADTCEDHIALRGGKRFIARLESVVTVPSPPAVMRHDGTYLITGGLGALGLRIARWMVHRGARDLVLLGRSNPSSTAQAVIAELRRRGATVTVERADIADAADLRRILAQIDASGLPLRGIVHAAGVHGHDLLPALDADALRRVLRPKIAGAWLLHDLTSSRDLDFFLCFSSIASLWGSSGQTHYAAANSFLDALAHYRRQRGLPALSINWGPWNDGGMATAEARRRLARVGVRSLNPDDALNAMERSLASADAQIAIADVDWVRLDELLSIGRKRSLLADLAQAHRRQPATAPRAPSATAELAHLSRGERRDWLTQHVERRVRAVLGLDQVGALDRGSGFFRLGMDSMMAVELKNRLAEDFGLTLPTSVIFDYPSIITLVDHLMERVPGTSLPERPDAETRPPPTVEAPAGPLPEAIAAKLAKLEALMQDM